MDFECSYHAELKLIERRISKSEIEDILTNPENVFLDMETGNLVTVIDTSKNEIIKNREEKGRWIRIK